MKSIITLVALVIMASPSFAATTKKASATKKTTTTSTTATTTKKSEPAVETPSYSSHSVTKDGINWQAGLGLGTAGSQFHIGALVQGLYPVSKMAEGDILVGGQTGFLFGPGTPSSWMIPILVQGQFNFKGNGKITPYAGLAMGLSIYHVSIDVPAIVAAYVPSVSATSTNFAMLVKGGIFFGEDQKYFAELPLGTMGSAFAIFPTIGMRF